MVREKLIPSVSDGVVGMVDRGRWQVVVRAGEAGRGARGGRWRGSSVQGAARYSGSAGIA